MIVIDYVTLGSLLIYEESISSVKTIYVSYIFLNILLPCFSGAVLGVMYSEILTKTQLSSHRVFGGMFWVFVNTDQIFTRFKLFSLFI